MTVTHINAWEYASEKYCWSKEAHARADRILKDTALTSLFTDRGMTEHAIRQVARELDDETRRQSLDAFQSFQSACRYCVLMANTLRRPGASAHFADLAFTAGIVVAALQGLPTPEPNGSNPFAQPRERRASAWLTWFQSEPMISLCSI